MDFQTFFGRLHPLVVHLPIGTLALASVFIVLQKRKSNAGLDRAVQITLLVSLLSAIMSVVFGLLLVADGSYSSQLMEQHKWMGIGLAAYTLLLYLQSRDILLPSRQLLPALIPGMLLLTATGHLGGSLTHGEGYLEEALLGSNKVEVGEWANPDSVDYFADLVQPILNDHCVQCHSAGNTQGKLDLSSWAAMKEGGQSNHPLLANAERSEIFKRITLPRDDKEFMPPRGEELDFAEVEIIRDWLNKGAAESMLVSEQEFSSEISSLLQRDFNLDVQPKAWFEKVTLPALDSQQLNVLTTQGWKVNQLAQGNPLLDLGRKKGDTLTLEDFEALKSVESYITWLDLGTTKLPDGALEHVSKLSNLTRLRLDKTDIQSTDLAPLTELQHLEYINLHQSAVDENCLEILAQIPSLRRVFLWGSEVKPEAAEEFQKLNPKLEIDLGESEGTQLAS